EVHWSDNAEAYVTPVADDCVGVAIVFHGKGSFDYWLAQFPDLQQKFWRRDHGPSAGGGPFEQRGRSRVPGRALLAGDAAGSLDPMTGEGLRLGFMAAEKLIECLRDGHPTDYEGAWQRLTAHYWKLTDALLWLGEWTFARHFTVPFLQCCPWLMDWGLGYVLT